MLKRATFAALGLALSVFTFDGAHASIQVARTSLNDCRIDTPSKNETTVTCKGPQDLSAVLQHADGKTDLKFGRSVRHGNGIAGRPFNLDEPIEVGAVDSPFGDRVEWLFSEYKPCATIVPITTATGPRFVVTSFKSRDSRVAVDPSPDNARRLAELACSGEPVEKETVEWVPLKYEVLYGDHPIVKALWGDQFETAIMPNDEKEPWAWVAEHKGANGRTVYVSVFPDRMSCGAAECLMGIMVDKNVTVKDVRTCDFHEEHAITKAGDLVRACDREFATKVR